MSGQERISKARSQASIIPPLLKSCSAGPTVAARNPGFPATPRRAEGSNPSAARQARCDVAGPRSLEAFLGRMEQSENRRGQQRRPQHGK
jgi:hypothetical protein